MRCRYGCGHDVHFAASAVKVARIVPHASCRLYSITITMPSDDRTIWILVLGPTLGSTLS